MSLVGVRTYENILRPTQNPTLAGMDPLTAGTGTDHFLLRRHHIHIFLSRGWLLWISVQSDKNTCVVSTKAWEQETDVPSKRINGTETDRSFFL